MNTALRLASARHYLTLSRNTRDSEWKNHIETAMVHLSHSGLPEANPLLQNMASIVNLDAETANSKRMAISVLVNNWYTKIGYLAQSETQKAEPATVETASKSESYQDVVIRQMTTILNEAKVPTKIKEGDFRLFKGPVIITNSTPIAIRKAPPQFKIMGTGGMRGGYNQISGISEAGESQNVFLFQNQVIMAADGSLTPRQLNKLIARVKDTLRLYGTNLQPIEYTDGEDSVDTKISIRVKGSPLQYVWFMDGKLPSQLRLSPYSVLLKSESSLAKYKGINEEERPLLAKHIIQREQKDANALMEKQRAARLAREPVLQKDEKLMEMNIELDQLKQKLKRDMENSPYYEKRNELTALQSRAAFMYGKQRVSIDFKINALANDLEEINDTLRPMRSRMLQLKKKIEERQKKLKK